MNKPSEFWEGKVVAGPNGCHIFTGATTRNGYGLIWKNTYAHRKMYEECWGPIPQGLNVLHKCSVKRCINPLHLYAGTQKDNAQDYKQAGGCIFSEEHKAKLSEALLGKKHTTERRLRRKGFSEELIQKIAAGALAVTSTGGV